MFFELDKGIKARLEVEEREEEGHYPAQLQADGLTFFVVLEEFRADHVNGHDPKNEAKKSRCD